MTALHAPTQRRLKKLSQIPSVWEGDRRPLPGMADNHEQAGEGNEDCIIWVDGSEGMVRAMDVVSPEMGPEAIVRTLLRAIENPQSPCEPARPKKIIVRDREIQFFLRGALQNLGIAIDYAPELPIIDELFRGFEAIQGQRPPFLPPQYADLLYETAYEIWDEGPWDVLADHNILSIELNYGDVTKLYPCVMGMLAEEYGIIFYRSIDSLRRFRNAVLSDQSLEELEKDFLSQDCWFVNFEADSDVEPDDEEDFDLGELSSSQVRPIFGSIHPYEGIRPFLDEEEAIAVYLGLKAILSFVDDCYPDLEEEVFPPLEKNYRIPLPQRQPGKKTISVTVSTLPDLDAEFLAMMEGSESERFGEDPSTSLPLYDNLVPENSLISIGMLPWDVINLLREARTKYYQSQNAPELDQGLPIVMIQTSRPKAKALIEQIQQLEGLSGIGFNPGEDPFTDTTYDLGILRTGNDHLHLFGEFISDEPTHAKARKNWERRSQQTKGYCGLVVASGVTGSSRGNPQVRDILAFFEAKALSAKDLGMGVLELMPTFGFEIDD